MPLSLEDSLMHQKKKKNIVENQKTTPLTAQESRSDILSIENVSTMEELLEVIKDCRRCRLCENRTHIVVGSGSGKSGIMVVGEGPGAEEDRQGLPFVGQAGQLLTKMLKAIEIQREDVYITNVVKCRPPMNRDPQGDEILACRPYLLKQIELLKPKVILTLGGYASRTLLDKPAHTSLSSLRGKIWDFEGIPLMCTYHPAALLYKKHYKRPAWEDLKAFQKFLKNMA